jgi:DNA polymerase III delta' subunit
MPFSDIPGNGRVKKILRLSLARNRAPHSLLFCGPRGIGKLKTARVLAKALNCLTLPDDACDACPNCEALNRGLEEPERGFPDYVEVEAETEEIKIAQMKEVREIAYFKPMIGRKRVFVINEAERLNDEAGNCLLKVLEEPPGWSHFILVTENPSRILPTIRSRCQTLAFMPVATEEIEQALRDRGFEEEQARILALLVHGNLEQALKLDWDEIQSRREETWDLFRAMVTGGEASLFLRRFAFLKKSEVKDDLKSTLELFASFCRDLVLLRDAGEPSLLLNPDYEPRLREIGGGPGFGRAMRFLEAIDTAFADLDRSLNTGLLIASLYSQVQG